MTLHGLVWAAVLLDGCPNVDTRTVRVETGLLLPGSGSVPLIEIGIHAASQDDAARLAEDLRLGEVESQDPTSDRYGTVLWRTWRGWVADESCAAAVSVEVTGADRVPGTAVA